MPRLSAGPRRLRSRLVILMDQTPEDVPAFNVRRESRDARGVGRDGYGETDAALRTLRVVVGHRRRLATR